MAPPDELPPLLLLAEDELLELPELPEEPEELLDPLLASMEIKAVVATFSIWACMVGVLITFSISVISIC